MYIHCLHINKIHGIAILLKNLLDNLCFLCICLQLYQERTHYPNLKNIFYFRIFLPWILSNSMTAFDSFMRKFVYGYNYYIGLYIFNIILKNELYNNLCRNIFHNFIIFFFVLQSYMKNLFIKIYYKILYIKNKIYLLCSEH